MQHSPRRGWALVCQLGAVVAGLVLLAAACGSSSNGSTKAGGASIYRGDGVAIQPAPGDGSGNPDAGAGAPKRGGKVTYALHAEDDNGYCLPEAQLDASGEQVAGSVYDTLTRPTADGKFVPYLAKAVDHSADYTTWTITLRPGISFSDGSPLNAQVVKNNLDAYRGVYPGRTVLLFRFVFDDIADVKATGPLTVEVDMKKPWRDFDAYLYGSRRIGIMGQKQLDDKTNCATDLIGTGPYELQSWTVGKGYVLKPNPHYWRTGADGKPLPYLSELDYVPIPDSQAEVSALAAGSVDAAMSPMSSAVVSMKKLASSGKVRLITSLNGTEVTFFMMNAKRAPFDDQSMRRAAVEAVNMAQVNKQLNGNLTALASQPFSPGNLAYTTAITRTPWNMPDAKKLVAAYAAKHGGAPKVVVSTTADTADSQFSTVVVGYLKQAGFDASVLTISQAELISDTIKGQFQMHTGRNYGGLEPGLQYVWWHTGYPTNFAGLNDPIVDCLLEVGRSGQAAAGCLKDQASNAAYNQDLPAGFKPLDQIDPNDLPAIYQAVSEEFKKKSWSLWGPYAPWSVATAPNVHGVFGPPNPDGSAPSRSLAYGTPVEGLWVG